MDDRWSCATALHPCKPMVGGTMHGQHISLWNCKPRQKNRRKITIGTLSESFEMPGYVSSAATARRKSDCMVREDKRGTDGKNETPMASRNGHHLKNRERREASPRCGFLTHGSFLFKPLQYPTNCTIITRHTSILVLTLRDWQNKKYPHMYGSLLFFPNTLEICFGSV